MKVKPKKSLGQNFLVNDSLAKKIVDFGNISKDDIVLEIGPGAGKLTEKIINKKPKKIIVIEKDVNLVSILSKKFNKKIDVINEDILKFNEKKLPYKKIIAFGNLPYNISTQILVKLIKLDNLNDYTFLLVVPLSHLVLLLLYLIFLLSLIVLIETIQVRFLFLRIVDLTFLVP